MGEVTRGSFVFSGRKAEESAHYFDIVLSRGYHGNLGRLAWDAAHKFGSRVMGSEFVSFRHGLILGERACEAAEFFDTNWSEAFAKCPEAGKRALMRSFGRELLTETEDKFGVEISVEDGYYY